MDNLTVKNIRKRPRPEGSCGCFEFGCTCYSKKEDKVSFLNTVLDRISFFIFRA